MAKWLCVYRGKNIEQTPNHGVYFCMTNGGIIEGNTGDISALSDLSPVIGYAGQQYWTDDCDWWSKRFGLMLGSQRGTSIWGGRYGLWPATAPHNMSPHYRRKIGNPIAEKEARLRPQHFISSRSRMGNAVTDAHARSIAVAQRLYFATLGAGQVRVILVVYGGIKGLL